MTNTPLLVPHPKWRTNLIKPDELIQWVDSRPEATFYDIWDETINPAWLPCLAKAGGATKQQLVFAVCAVARLCLPLLPEGDDVPVIVVRYHPRIIIETAEAWCRGEATEKQVLESRGSARRKVSGGDYLFVTASAFAAASSAINNDKDSIYFYYAYTVYFAMRAGVESQVACKTLRKHLPFERPPRPKGLTVWQRIATGNE